jgi:site-specific DNA recombinase
MYPKLTKRTTADGKPIYTYVCKMKERSQRSICNSKNVNGNTLDLAIIEQIKSLEEDSSTFITQLERSRQFYTGNKMQYEEQLANLRDKKAETEKKIETLVDSLVELDTSTARSYVTKRIEQLHQNIESIDANIRELEALTSQNALSDIEFDVLRQLLSVFHSSVDEMTLEQKRSAVRTLVRKVIWDGVNAHVVLFGAEESDIEYPDLSPLYSENNAEEEACEELLEFSDVDYEDGSKTLLCEGNK